MYAEELMYWASIDKPAVKMASLKGTHQVTLLNESKADYTGITLYNNNLYISDSSRRSVFLRHMLRRARLCHSKSSVRLSVCSCVCDVEVCFSHRLEYFENNFTAE